MKKERVTITARVGTIPAMRRTVYRSIDNVSVRLPASCRSGSCGAV
jgi:hypothetical protein